LAACPELFGDILTRGHISSSDGCKIAGVTGGLSSQGVKDVYTHNLLAAGSEYTIAKPEHSNFDGGQEIPIETGDQLAADSVTVKWARSK